MIAGIRSSIITETDHCYVICDLILAADGQVTTEKFTKHFNWY